MIKVIPISAVLLLSVGSASAQYGGATSTTTTSPDLSTTTTPSTSPSPGISNGIGTPGVGTTVAPTIVTTPSTGITTTTPGTSTTTIPGGTVTGTTGGGTTTTIPGSTISTTTTITTPTTFTCTGNNPTWNLSVSKDLITYSSAKEATVKIKSVLPMLPVGDSTGNVQAYLARGNDGKPVTILIKKNMAGCTNGLPGTSYQYDVFVIFPTMIVMGCCNPV